MQYTTITAVFALFASAVTAMPAAVPADAGALVARNGNWVEEYPFVKTWLPYRKLDGAWCKPDDEDYSYSTAYSASSYTSYGYRYSSGHLQARNYDWRREYPHVKFWLPYRKQGGGWCKPEDDDYSYTVAYSSSSYTSYSYSDSH
ncbi:hypothetical protein DOTSEDRAFT_71166 [Dothistroma septosporum NZE10]|uniref:Uncharacterized protein n=1 Tax=Dothistroma septosporum (strain NZE10 / CBS 128990) TaxID=675120 RepID=N1PPN4_DOTSN|nr:hypothetical protein DOTSEDRAFT_71166 [Dothistroma septosporum NZE10]